MERLQCDYRQHSMIFLKHSALNPKPTVRATTEPRLLVIASIMDKQPWVILISSVLESQARFGGPQGEKKVLLKDTVCRVIYVYRSGRQQLQLGLLRQRWGTENMYKLSLTSTLIRSELERVMNSEKRARSGQNAQLDYAQERERRNKEKQEYTIKAQLDVCCHFT